MQTGKWFMAAVASLLIGTVWAQEDHTKSAVEQTRRAVESDQQGDTSGAAEHTKAAEEQARKASKDKGSSGKVISTGKSKKNRHPSKKPSNRPTEQPAPSGDETTNP